MKKDERREKQRQREIDRENRNENKALDPWIYFAAIPPYVRPRMYKQIRELACASPYGKIFFFFFFFQIHSVASNPVFAFLK